MHQNHCQEGESRHQQGRTRDQGQYQEGEGRNGDGDGDGDASSWRASVGGGQAAGERRRG